MGAIRQLSPLSARYNGFVLGHFMALAAFSSLRPRYRHLQARVNAFLGSVGISKKLPPTPEAFHAASIEEILAVLTELRNLSSECASSAWLSSAVIFKARGAPSIRRKHILAAADALSLDHKMVLDYEHSIPRMSPVSLADLLGPSMDFLCRFLDELRSEHRTCFVAMPFRAPYERYVDEFYRPALEHLGYRAIRAWGGVGMERYLEVVLALIKKSGACLADVTGQNPNVLYELGAAQGMGKKVYIVVEATRRKLAANITQHTAFRFHYRPDAKDWPESEVMRFVAQNSFAEFATIQSDAQAG